MLLGKSIHTKKISKDFGVAMCTRISHAKIGPLDDSVTLL